MLSQNHDIFLTQWILWWRVNKITSSSVCRHLCRSILKWTCIFYDYLIKKNSPFFLKLVAKSIATTIRFHFDCQLDLIGPNSLFWAHQIHFFLLILNMVPKIIWSTLTLYMAKDWSRPTPRNFEKSGKRVGKPGRP